LGGANFPVGHGFTPRSLAAPNGEIVDGKGVSPDLDVALSGDGLRVGKDNQLDAAVRHVSRM
jgi:hypothetical protein